MRLAILVAVAACGRIGFDPGSGSGDGSMPGDALVTPDAFFGECPVGMTAPDPITLTGSIERKATASAVPGMTLSISTTLDGSPIATTTTDATGAYSVDVPTGGVPIAMYITLSEPGYLTAVEIPDRLLDANTAESFVEGTQADLDATYATKSVTESLSAGTLYIGLFDCTGTGIAGAAIQTTPPTTIVYADVNSVPDAALTSTTSSSIALALDVPVGPVIVSVTAPGMTFTDQRIETLQNPIITACEIAPTP